MLHGVNAFRGYTVYLESIFIGRYLFINVKIDRLCCETE